MINRARPFFAGVVTLALAATLPTSTFAHSSQVAETHVSSKTHTLPASSGSGTVTVFHFGIQGGNMRPLSVVLALDGSITVTAGTSPKQRFRDPKNTLQGLLALADAEGFFSLKKSTGCLSKGINPDISSRFISIHTSSGTKRVQEFGSCAATAKYDQLYAVLMETTGVS